MSREYDSFDSVCARVRTLQSVEQGVTNPLCATQLLCHGGRTRQAIALLHGYTNCPRQFQLFAKRLHGLGYNVLAPRLPYHGQRTRTPANLARLTVAVLTAFGNEVVDIVAGLGEQVTVLGFSMGGVLAARLAQQRSEIDRAVIVAAPFGLRSVPSWQRPFYVRVLANVPDRFLWWSPELREKVGGPSHGYAGFSTRGVGEMLRLGLGVQAAARRKRPAAKKILVITNESDEVVDNRPLEWLAGAWRAQGHPVRMHTFPADAGLIHDFMDPEQPQQKVDFVYPQLLNLVTGGWE